MKPTPIQPHVECLPLTMDIRSSLTKRHHEQLWTIYRSFRQPLAEDDLKRLAECWNAIVVQYKTAEA